MSPVSHTTNVRLVSTVDRATRILDALAAGGGEAGTSELARATGINVATVSRILATLAVSEYVEQAPSGRYRLGLKLAQLAQRTLARLDVRALGRATLEGLAKETGETATLSLVGDHEAVTADFVPGAASVISVARIGRPSVLHATAVGKIVLAFGPRGLDALPAGDLVPFTPATRVEREALAADVARARETGYASAVGEREQDMTALAAPVLDATGRLAAILGLQGPTSRIDARRLEELAELLNAAATRHGSVMAG